MLALITTERISEMTEQTIAKKAERSKWAATYDRYQAAKAALMQACKTEAAEDDKRFQELYEPFSDALTQTMFEPADSPFDVVTKLRIYSDEGMEDWRIGKPAFEMIISDINHFGLKGWQPDC